MAHSSHTKSSVSINLFNLPPLSDARRQSTMQCKISNNFFLPDGKSTQLSQIINTWMFDRLTPNDNEGVGVQMDYLECAYKTKYYIINKVNGQINTIQDNSLELTEFKGHFSHFDLDELEMKVCRLADRNKYKDDLPELQNAPQGQDSDSNLGSHNSEETTGMGFDENNYSPIPPVGNAASQQEAARPTSTPKPVVEADLNTLDSTHNRGKVKRINSFTTTQEQVETMRKPSKGGKVKSSHTRSQAQPSTSTQGSTGRPQV